MKYKLCVGLKRCGQADSVLADSVLDLAAQQIHRVGRTGLELGRWFAQVCAHSQLLLSDLLKLL